MVVRATVFILICVTVTAASASCQNCKDETCDGYKCLNGCKQGYAGEKCIHKCPINCLDSQCELSSYTGAYQCSFGCNPGYHGYHCNAPCNTTDMAGKCDCYSGTIPDCGGTRWGENCETSCLSNCKGLVCDNSGKCFGNVCIPGRYGTNCSMSCDSNCRFCHINTGKCLKFAEKEAQDSIKCSCETGGDVLVRAMSTNVHVITALLVIIAVGVMFQTADICMRWKERSNTKTSNYISEGDQLTNCSSSLMRTKQSATNSYGSQADRVKKRSNIKTASNYISKRDCDSNRLTASSSGSTTELVTSSSSGIDTSSASQADRVKTRSNIKTASNYISKRDCDSKRLTSSSSGSTTELVTSSSSGIDTSSASQAERGTDGEEMVCVSCQSRCPSSGFETSSE